MINTDDDVGDSDNDGYVDYGDDDDVDQDIVDDVLQ